MSLQNFGLILIRGIPGSGKSTLARKILSVLSGVLCEADDYFLEGAQYVEGSNGELTMEGGTFVFDGTKIAEAHWDCQDRVRVAMQSGMRVVVTSVFSSFAEMEPYVVGARSRGIPVAVIEVEGAFTSIHGVPEETIESYRTKRFSFSNQLAAEKGFTLIPQCMIDAMEQDRSAA